MVVSVKETKANPYYTLFEEKDGFLEKSKKGNFVRAQDCPKVYEYNGAVYIINIDSLKKTKLSDFKKVKKFVMDEKSSLDIDTPLDFLVAQIILTKI
jgi:N-acylneuraminate cytidylyltransferase